MDKKVNQVDDWTRMITGKLYNSASTDIAKQHARGLIGCDRFNRIAVWRKKKKQRALEKLIPSAKGKDFGVFAPFYCEYGVNIHVGKECFVNYNCTFLDVSDWRKRHVGNAESFVFSGRTIKYELSRR